MTYVTGRRANRVLIISEHFPPRTGGTATHAYNLCKYLVRMGWEVYLITEPSSEDANSEWYEKDGIHIYRLNIPDVLMKETLFPRSFPTFLLKQIRRVILQFRPDVVHFASGWYPLMVTRFCPGFSKIPVVWTVHNVPPAEHHLSISSSNRINKPLERLYFGALRSIVWTSLKFYRYDRIIAVSEATATKIIETGISPNTICVIPNGIDIPCFTSRERRKTSQFKAQPIVLTVAGITEHKGQLNIIRGAPEVIAKFPKVLFLLVGPIRRRHYLDLLQEAIRELGLEQNVKVTGAVSQRDLLSYYSLCDLYLQPSLEEGFCITMLEAMACGKPVIGTPVGEIPKLITESKAGILISESSPAQISEAVITLLENKEARKELGERARQYVAANYSWEAVAKETANLYQEVMTKGIRQ